MNNTSKKQYQFGVVECIESGTVNGHLFKKGECYALVGWNNGVHIIYEDDYGNPRDLLCHGWDKYAPVELDSGETQDGNIPPFFI